MLNELTQATRGQLAVRLAREVILPAMSPYAEISTWALAERLLPQAPSAWTTHASDGHSTDFATISELARTWAVGRTPGAVIMISDGRNHGGDPRPALRALAARGARVLTVAVGDAAAPDEPALLNLDGPPLVRVGATIVLQADVRRGRDPTRAWDVVLRVDERIVQRIPVPVSGSLRCQVRGEFPTGVSGLRMCAARLEPAVAVGSTADPSPETSGAWMSCPVRVTDAPLRVLVAEALPRWETRALVAALEADPLCVVERRYLQGPGAVVAAVPVDAVAGADAIILGDLLPTELPFDDQARLAAFVADGGFLAVVAGPRGMPVAFPLGPLADLLPVCVRRGGMSLSGSSSAGLSSLSLTQSGEQHPVTRLLADPDLNRRLWAALPAPAWVAGGLMAAADAEVLAEAASGPHEIAPVVAVRASGGGRVLWMGAPETWRWRTFERGRAQIAFWQQALRWGLAGRPRGADTRLRVAVDPPRIMARGTAEILISAAHEPTAVLRDEHGGTTSLPLRAAGSGRWRGVVADMPAGLYQVAVTLGALREAGALQEADAQNPTGALREERDLLVRPRAAEELGDPSADPQALRALALDCGGHASTVAGLRPALESLARGLHPEAVTTLSSWRFAHGPWLALALMVLLIGEWWWRKRQGLP